ncbi:MAG: hypothetical protein ACRC62_39345 [Microcoleus sp.]
MPLTLPKTALKAIADRVAIVNEAPIKINWAPDPGNKPQQEAYLSPADRLFYGGSAGGG